MTKDKIDIIEIQFISHYINYIINNFFLYIVRLDEMHIYNIAENWKQKLWIFIKKSKWAD